MYAGPFVLQVQLSHNTAPSIEPAGQVCCMRLLPAAVDTGLMPILDMKVWMEDGDIMFQHYEKPTASGNIMHANAAQSVTFRNSVHTQEILRRLLNSSPLLDWESCVAPVHDEAWVPTAI